MEADTKVPPRTKDRRAVPRETVDLKPRVVREHRLRRPFYWLGSR